jgi:hypothetical protein
MFEARLTQGNLLKKLVDSIKGEAASASMQDVHVLLSSGARGSCDLNVGCARF